MRTYLATTLLLCFVVAISSDLKAQSESRISLEQTAFNAKAELNWNALVRGTPKAEVTGWILKSEEYEVSFGEGQTRVFNNLCLTEQFVKNGNAYQILWYVTEWRSYEVRKVLPVVFENDVLIGWGYEFLESNEITKSMHGYRVIGDE